MYDNQDIRSLLDSATDSKIKHIFRKTAEYLKPKSKDSSVDRARKYIEDTINKVVNSKEYKNSRKDKNVDNTNNSDLNFSLRKRKYIKETLKLFPILLNF